MVICLIFKYNDYMHKILFVCHGNVCRSTMAEFIMKNMVKEADVEKNFLIESAATSTEEIGNDTYPNAKAKLRQEGIPFTKREARQIRSSDYDRYDLLIGMDNENLFYMNRCWNNDPLGKVHKLMEYTGSSNEVSDPWYSGDFDTAYNDINQGCRALLAYLLKERL